MNDPSDSHSLTLAVIAGSCFLPLAAKLAAIHADGALVSDVPSELSRLPPLGKVLRIPLGGNHTTTTMIEEAVRIDPERFGPVAKSMRSAAPTDLRIGLGQCATLGWMAWTVAAGIDGLRSRAFNDLLVPLWGARNAVLDHVNVDFFATLAGGAGCLVSRSIAECIGGVIHERMGCVVNINGLQCGALSFLGLGERIFQNAAAGIIEQVAYTLDHESRHPYEVRTLVLAELPAASRARQRIDQDRDCRSSLAATLAAGWFSRGASLHVHALRPNREFARPYGSISVLRPSWFGLLSAEAVGFAAARHYELECAGIRTLNASNPGSVGEIRVETSTTCLDARRTWQDLVEQASRVRGEKPPLWDQEVLTGPSLTGWISVGGIPIEKVVPTVPDLADLDGFQSQTATLRSLGVCLETALTERRSQAAALRKLLVPLRGKLLAAADRLFEHSWLVKAQSYLYGRPAFVQAFRRRYEDYHLVLGELCEAELAEKLLAGAITRVRDVSAAFNAFLQRLCSTLAALSDGSDKRMKGGIVFKPLASVFGEVAGAVKRGNVPGLREFLPGTAQSLTLEGVAHLIGAEPTAQGVARRLVGDPDYESPFWGGQSPRREPVLRVVVLPPVDAPVLGAVKEAMEQCGLSSHLIVQADSLAAGASVLMTELYEIKGVGELFPRPYLAALKQILTTGSDLYVLSPRGARLAEEVLHEERGIVA